MENLRRSGMLVKRRCENGLYSALVKRLLKRGSDVGLPTFYSSTAATQTALIHSSTPKSLGNFKLGYLRQPTGEATLGSMERLGANGNNVLHGWQCDKLRMIGLGPSLQLVKLHGSSTANYWFARSFSSKASKETGETKSEARKEVSTVEDPFDAPTYNIPEKPVSFTEGASYSIIILAGLGVAAVAAYAVFKELIFEPKEYKIFNMALKRIQDDAQVRVRIGSPITGYGQESRNRAARQRIPNKIYIDEDGVEHVLVNFYIRGPHGAGKVSAEMFRDKVDKKWKYTYLIVQFMQPNQTQLILESYMPAPAPVPA